MFFFFDLYCCDSFLMIELECRGGEGCWCVEMGDFFLGTLVFVWRGRIWERREGVW